VGLTVCLSHINTCSQFLVQLGQLMLTIKTRSHTLAVRMKGKARDQQLKSPAEFQLTFGHTEDRLGSQAGLDSGYFFHQLGQARMPSGILINNLTPLDNTHRYNIYML
jgi:hypothetical protein